MGANYMWKNKPRIVTYSNPREINNNPELMKIISTYPHLCASDTLLMGLIHRYSRSTFTFLATVEAFMDNIFEHVINSKEIDLQMFIDISSSIEHMQTESSNVKRAMTNNRASLVEAFKMLSLLQYECKNQSDSEELNLFFEHIYLPNASKYINKYKEQMECCDLDKCRRAFQECLMHDAKYQLKLEEDKSSEIATKIQQMAASDNLEAKVYNTLLNNSEHLPIDTIIIHGVARFTPEIMMLIRTLDEIGVKIVFLINYVDNLPGVYDFWKKVYGWVGVEFEFVESLSLESGNVVGKNIAKICNGIRPTDKSFAEIIKYSTITDFTDGPVRKEFIKAESKAKESNKQNVLAYMKTQYYAVAADRPNDILRNYFPEQFIDKPFLAYPIGQFIKGLFSMWNFEKMEMSIDFDVLKECAAVKIGHQCDNMIRIIDRVQLYFKGLESVTDITARIKELTTNLQGFDQDSRRVFSYLSFFSLSVNEIETLGKYICELERMSKIIFGTDKEKQIVYQTKFKELITIVSGNAVVDNVLSQKENELIATLINALSVSNETKIIGGVKELRDALYFFLSVRKDNSSADWIIRGFDQIDGAPLMRMPAGRIYEFSMMSMKNMTKSVRDILPWPLDEKVFDEEVGNSVFLEQMNNIVEFRNEYLRFYFFYGAFFSKGAQIKFSYVENDNDEKQRPYYMLDLLGLPVVTTNEKSNSIKYEVVDSEDMTNSLERKFTPRELDLFSICPYKFFLTCVLHRNLFYSSEFHINYFLENEIVNLVELDSGYDIDRRDNSLKKVLEYIAKIFPYIDETLKSDIERFVIKNFSNRRRGENYLQKKRDFLIATWKNLETNESYMRFDKSIGDVENYMRSKQLLPNIGMRPHSKVCEECNYNELCLNYYLDKEVDE